MPELLEAIQLKNYYAVAALSLTLLVQIFRKAPFTRDLWAKIPTGWHFMVPLLSGAITAFTEAFASGSTLTEALTAALFGGMGIGLGAMGLNAALTDSKLPWNGGAGGVPKDSRYRDTLPPPPPPPSGLSGGIGFAACIALLALSCTGAQPAPCSSQDAVMVAKAAECRARVKAECPNTPDDQCPVVAECDAWAAERCGGAK